MNALGLVRNGGVEVHERMLRLADSGGGGSAGGHRRRGGYHEEAVPQVGAAPCPRPTRRDKSEIRQCTWHCSPVLPSAEM